MASTLHEGVLEMTEPTSLIASDVNSWARGNRNTFFLGWGVWVEYRALETLNKIDLIAI
jgi:hypothetical protein